MGNFELLNSGAEMILTEKKHRAHRRMWAALNMKLFADRQEWDDTEHEMLVSMLGLEEEAKWVNESRQPSNSSELETTSANSKRQARQRRQTQNT